MGRSVCPFCLKQHDLNGHCPTTNEPCPAPATFFREYEEVRPLWLASIGLSAQSRAAYFSTMNTMLEQLSLVFDDVYTDALDPYTANALSTMRRETQAETTKLQRPLLLSVYNMPLTGSHCLVLYDFTDDAKVLADASVAPAARQCSTVWFFVSLGAVGGMSIVERFKAYRDAMERLDIDLRGRNLVVVYTDLPEQPEAESLQAHLHNDPLPTRTGGAQPGGLLLTEYLTGLEHISEELHSYTRSNLAGGAAFINMVKARGMRLRFCVATTAGNGAEQSQGARVLDPFFWSIELDRQGRDRSFQIAVDPASPEAYARALQVWEALIGVGSVTTYALGRLQPLAAAGQRPPENLPGSQAPRLIGPIVEQLPPASKLVVWAGGPILDLADFADSTWRERLILVTNQGADAQEWPTTIAYGPADRPERIVETLLRTASQEGAQR